MERVGPKLVGDPGRWSVGISGGEKATFPSSEPQGTGAEGNIDSQRAINHLPPKGSRSPRQEPTRNQASTWGPIEGFIARVTRVLLKALFSASALPFGVTQIV